MKNKLYHVCLALVCCTGFTACYTPRYMYSPNATNVPNLTAKGDSKLAVYYSFGNKGRRSLPDGDDAKAFRNNGLDAQGAYAFSNHLGVLVNHSTRRETNSGSFENIIDSAVIRYKRRLTELGVGYFGRFNKSKSLFQVFVGYSFGQSGFTDAGKDGGNVYYNRYHRANISKVFLQPAIQADISPNFTTAFANRFNFVFYGNVQTDYTNEEQVRYLLDQVGGRATVFWEPSLINNFGIKELPGLRFELQVGFASLVSRKFLDYRTLNISIGTMADLGKLFAKKPAGKVQTPSN